MLHIARGALYAFFTPDHIAFGGRIREHEPAGGVGAEGFNDVVGVHHIAFGFRHLLDGADSDLGAALEHGGAASTRARLDLDVAGLHPLAIRSLIGLVNHHALGEQALEGLRKAQMAGRLHGPREEARIEEMQDRVFDATDVLIDRQPVIGHRLVGGALLVPGIGEAGEIPGRIHEGVHGVRLAPGGLAAVGAGDVLPAGVVVQRIAGHVQLHILRQLDGQRLFRRRNNIAGLAMDHGDRAAPVALARNAPIAQAEVHLPRRLGLAADINSFEAFGDLLLRRRDGHAIKEPGVDHAPVAVIGHNGHDEAGGVLPLRANHGDIPEPIRVDEVQVALVMGGAAENGAGSIFHEHEVGDVDRYLPIGIEGMGDAHAGVETLLLGCLQRGHRSAHAPTLGDEGRELRISLGHLGRQRMIRGHRHEAGAKERVRAGGVDLKLGLARRRRCRIDSEPNQKPLGAPNPVLLHQPNLFRPAIEGVERVEQVLREIRDLEEPLGQLALLNQCARAPAAPVDDLLIGEHGLVHRIPVHLGFLAVDEASLQEIQEHGLLVLVIAGIAGRDLARPVQGKAHAFQLPAHGRDIGVGPGSRVTLVQPRRVFGGHAEGVPAHGMQHIETLGPAIARDDIAHGVVAHMAHVDAARRIGKHLQHIIFGARIIVPALERLTALPKLLPLGFGLTGVVAFGMHVRYRSDSVQMPENRGNEHHFGGMVNGFAPHAGLMDANPSGAKTYDGPGSPLRIP